MNLPTINCAQLQHHAAGCCFRSALRHPRALTFWLCLRLKLLAGQQTFHPRGGQMSSPSHIPSPPPIIIITHPSSLLTHPSLSPSHFPRCLVTLARYLAPPFLHGGGEEERGSKRGCSPLPPCPQGPLARLPLLLLSTAVAQYQTLTSWDLNPAGEPEEEPQCVRAHRLSRCLFTRWTTPTLTPSTAAKSLCSGWEDPLFEHGCGTSGPGTYPAPGARPAHPGASTRLGRLPKGLQVLVCHATVPGSHAWYRQHPGAGTTRKRERDRDVSMMSIYVLHALTCLTWAVWQAWFSVWVHSISLCLWWIKDLSGKVLV